MFQNDHPQSNPGAIEDLKAATRQVVQLAPRNKNPGSPTVKNPAVNTARGGPQQKRQSMPVSETFAEAFAGKITSVEQEKAKIEKEQLAVDQEIDRAEKLRSDLTEKKKQLENRRNELITLKDKLIALDKELNMVLKLPSL